MVHCHDLHHRGDWQPRGRDPARPQPPRTDNAEIYSGNIFSIVPDERNVGVSVQVSDSYEPTEDGTSSQLFISKTYDATSHFETTCVDVLDIFKRGTGEEFDFSKVKHTLEDQE